MSQRADCSAILFSVQITGNVVIAINARRYSTGSDLGMYSSLEYCGDHFWPVLLNSTDISSSENYQWKFTQNKLKKCFFGVKKVHQRGTVQECTIKNFEKLANYFHRLDRVDHLWEELGSGRRERISIRWRVLPPSVVLELAALKGEKHIKPRPHKKDLGTSKGFILKFPKSTLALLFMWQFRYRCSAGIQSINRHFIALTKTYKQVHECIIFVDNLRIQ